MSKLTKALTAAAGNAGDAPLYVEDVFSTYLYTGADANETVTNGIDLAGEGGFVWIKPRTTTGSHLLFDTERGTGKYLVSSSAAAEATYNPYLSSFNSDGFTTFAFAPADYASWTFRKAEKFFDVQTWTGNGVAGRAIAHNLGSVPAVIITKRYDAAGAWWTVYHKNSPNSVGWLNETNAFDGNDMQSYYGNGTSAVTPTSSVFTVSSSANLNGSSATYVAYIFASDAGGFGADGSESVVKCGSYTGNATNRSVTLGWEPQYVLIKNTTNADNWIVFDMMRGVATGGVDAYLIPNSTSSEEAGTDYITFGATGFTVHTGYGLINESGSTYIYMAIRRPMKTPTAGTEVFAMANGTTSFPNWVSGFVTDFAWYKDVDSVYSNYWQSRLTGPTWLKTDSTDAQSSGSEAVWDFMNGFGAWSTVNNVEAWMFKRAAGFMDVVAYTGTGTNTTINHNLGVAPELMIVKRRDLSRAWAVWASGINIDDYLTLNGSGGVATFALWQSTLPTATQITLGTDASVNGSANTYIAYLFASVAGVSKVGSYTGTAATLNVDCGFTAGARFILIKRTDSTGDWYVYDSVRGISAGNDPYLLLNTTAAQVTNTDYVDPLASGFTVTSSAPAALNASGGTYIFLAIA